MSDGRPVNHAAISALRKHDIACLGHLEASKELKVKYGIDLSFSSVGRLRRQFGIPWSNTRLASKFVRDLRLNNKEPDFSFLINEMKVSPAHAERLIKGY